MDAVAFADFINVRDVRMIQRCGRFCFAHEAVHSIAVRSDLRGQDLQRNFTIEFRVLRQIHFAHSARADLRADLVTT